MASTRLQSLLQWLRAPMTGKFRARGTPARFRARVPMTHVNTRVYEGSVITADQLFSGANRGWAPYLVYHDWRLDWDGTAYEVQQKDWPRRFAFRTGQSFPGWVDPDDLSSVWILDGAHACRPWVAEEEDDPDEDGPLMAVDVHYTGDGRAMAAGVLFDDWNSPAPSAQVTRWIDDVAAYEPGQFYKRELPCILALIEAMDVPPSAVIVDGYVTLGADARDGLGMHLYRALGEKVTVIGVAKTAFEGTPDSAQLLRGSSKTPLYVTAAGMPQDGARSCITAMHGDHRMPTLLRAVDRLCRDAAIA